MVTPTAFASGAANAMGEDKLHRRSLDSLDYKRSFEQDFHDDEPEAQHTANNPASRLLPLYVSGEKRRKGVARYTRFITPLLWVLAVCISFYLGKHVRIDTSNGPPVTWAAAADVASSPLSSRPRDSFTFSNGSSWQRPQDLRIVGIVFCTLMTIPLTRRLQADVNQRRPKRICQHLGLLSTKEPRGEWWNPR